MPLKLQDNSVTIVILVVIEAAVGATSPPVSHIITYICQIIVPVLSVIVKDNADGCDNQFRLCVAKKIIAIVGI